MLKLCFILKVPFLRKNITCNHRWASSFVLEGVVKNSIRGGGHKKISGGVANFKKSSIFTLKLHDLAISGEKNWAGRSRRKFFLGAHIFKFFFLKKNVIGQKSKIQRGGQKALLEGVGSIWTLGGGVIKNRNRWGSTPPDTPLAHLCL